MASENDIGKPTAYKHYFLSNFLFYAIGLLFFILLFACGIG